MDQFVVIQKIECPCKQKGCKKGTWMTLWAPDFDFTYKGTCRIIGIFSNEEAANVISKETGFDFELSVKASPEARSIATGATDASSFTEY